MRWCDGIGIEQGGYIIQMEDGQDTMTMPRRPTHQNKVVWMLSEYELPDLAETLVTYWTRDE
jgi:hypothetical protein